MGIKKVLPDDVIELKQRVQDLVFLIKQSGNCRLAINNRIVITFSGNRIDERQYLNTLA